MRTLKNNKLTNILGATSAVALSLLGLFIITPPVTEGASAESQSTAVPLEVVNHQMLSLGMDTSSIKMEVTPTASGTFESAGINFTVNTNAVDGYKLYVGMLDSSNTALTNEADGSTASIPSISIDTAGGESFPANRWGYNLTRGRVSVGEDSVFSQAPSTVRTDSNMAKSQEYTLGFATKVDSNLDAGVYRNTMTISAVTNPVTISNLNQLVYMQDMTNKICQDTVGTDGNPVSASLHNEPSRQLIDTRDGKAYWVSKLADGNCWMVQNLALNIDAEKGLKAADTDIVSDWNKNSQYPPETTEKTLKNGSTSSSYGRSWNFGLYTIKNPKNEESCNEEYQLGNTDSCSTLQQIGNDWQGNLNYNGTGETFNATNKNYDPHFLIGNYYQGNAAMAGTGMNLTPGTNANGSICPKGWKLPVSSEANNTTSGSFYYLLNKYGLQTSINNGDYSITTTPLYFTRTGYINQSSVNSRMSGTGEAGHYWSSTAATSAVSNYILYFSNTRGTVASDSGHFMYARPIRCVAR